MKTHLIALLLGSLVLLAGALPGCATSGGSDEATPDYDPGSIHDDFTQERTDRDLDPEKMAKFLKLCADSGLTLTEKGLALVCNALGKTSTTRSRGHTVVNQPGNPVGPGSLSRGPNGEPAATTPASPGAEGSRGHAGPLSLLTWPMLTGCGFMAIGAILLLLAAFHVPLIPVKSATTFLLIGGAICFATFVAGTISPWAYGAAFLAAGLILFYEFKTDPKFEAWLERKTGKDLNRSGAVGDLPTGTLPGSPIGPIQALGNTGPAAAAAPTP